MRAGPALAWTSAALLLASFTGGVALRLTRGGTEGPITVPRVEMTAADGGIVELPVGGMPMLINFWATWCPPCKREITLLGKVAKMDERSYRIVGVAVDEPAAVLDFMQDHEIGFTLLIAGFVDGIKLVEKLGNADMAMPYSILVDEQGKIVKKKLGPFASTEEIVAFAFVEFDDMSLSADPSNLKHH